MNAAELFQAAVKADVAPTLVKHGFKRSKLLFRRDLDETIHFVQFQRSQKSTRDEVWFAVNLGVVSKLLMAWRAKRPATIGDCHWSERLSPGVKYSDHWWRVVDAPSAEASMGECVALLENTALPALGALSTNAALRDRWLSGQAAGISEVERLMNLHRLVLAIGPDDQPGKVRAELERLAQNSGTVAAVTYLRMLDRK